MRSESAEKKVRLGLNLMNIARINLSASKRLTPVFFLGKGGSYAVIAAKFGDASEKIFKQRAVVEIAAASGADEIAFLADTYVSRKPAPAGGISSVDCLPRPADDPDRKEAISIEIVSLVDYVHLLQIYRREGGEIVYDGEPQVLSEGEDGEVVSRLRTMFVEAVAGRSTTQ